VAGVSFFLVFSELSNLFLMFVKRYNDLSDIEFHCRIMLLRKTNSATAVLAFICAQAGKLGKKYKIASLPYSCGFQSYL